MFPMLYLWNKFSEKPKTFFEKLEYSAFVESTAIESVTLPDKTDLSKTNVNANRMESTK